MLSSLREDEWKQGHITQRYKHKEIVRVVMKVMTRDLMSWKKH